MELLRLKRVGLIKLVQQLKQLLRRVFFNSHFKLLPFSSAFSVSSPRQIIPYRPHASHNSFSKNAFALACMPGAFDSRDAMKPRIPATRNAGGRRISFTRAIIPYCRNVMFMARIIPNPPYLNN